MLHKISHWLGWNYGTVESFYIGDDLWVGFKCSGCGEINNAQKTNLNEKY